MPTRIPWNRHEVAMLFDAYLQVAEGVDLRQTAKRLSLTLREIALQSGQSIDETYRNENGMIMQLANVQYLFTNGKKGLSGASAMIRQTFELYKADPSAYQSILKEAIQMTGNTAMSVEDAFFAYAKGKIGLSQRMLSEYLKKAADYCHLKQSLLGMADVTAVRNVQQKVSEGKLLRFRYGRDAQTIRNVTLLYYNFIKSYREPKEDRPVHEVPSVPYWRSDQQTVKADQPTREVPAVAAQSDVAMDTTMEDDTSEPREEVIFDETSGSMPEISFPEVDTPEATTMVLREEAADEPADDRLWVNFDHDSSYLFTKPVSYTYKNQIYDARSWNRLYVEVCGLIFADNRDAFMGVMNGDIPGYHALAFADEQNHRQMRVPKSFAPGYYLESNLDATSIVRKLCGLHRLCGLTDELRIEYRKADGYQSSEPTVQTEIGMGEALSLAEDYDWHRDGLLLVDFSGEASYAFTQPDAYEYNGVSKRVDKWGKLYTNLCGLLITDHHDAFMSIMNGDIPGYKMLAFADEQHKDSMLAARRFAPGYYLESKMSATTIVRRIIGLHQLFNLGDKLRISYRKLGDAATAKSAEVSDEEWLIHELRTKKIPYVDNRAVYGCLWIASDLSTLISTSVAIEKGYHLHLKQDGCRAFPNRPVLWTKDQPVQPTKKMIQLEFDTSDFRCRLDEGFKPYLISEKGLAERTAVQYSQSVDAVEHFLLKKDLDCTLDIEDPEEAQEIYDILLSRNDFVIWNNQRHHQYSAALVQYVSYLRQRGGAAPVIDRKLQPQKTIIETVFDVLRQAGEPLTVSEIYQAIVKNNLYPFGAQNPLSVVYSKVSLACRQTEMRIQDGKDVLVKTEEDGKKKYQVMTAERAAAYPKTQQSDIKLAAASAWLEYETALKQAFPRGFQKESGLDMKKLRKRWAEIHGTELIDSDDTVRQQLAAHCVDTGKRWYLAELLLSNEDKQIVLQYIDRVLGSGKSVLYYSSIYAALEHQLESTVLTEDLLVSYLRATCKDRYILQDGYLTNDRSAKIDLAEEIKDVMLAHGRPIHTDDLKRVLHHLPPDRVERELHIHSEFIMDASHMYFHESMADLTEQELNQIDAFIQEEMDDQGYMIGDWIQRKLTQMYPETAERLSFLTPLGVRGAVAYKLRDRFNFSGPVITPKGMEMNMLDVFAMYCQHHAPFSLDELSAFARECDSIIYWDTVHRSCARVSEIEFVTPEAVRWDIPHVDAAIALHCPGKYVSLKSIRYFDAFPYVGYSWNSYLLEQYVATVSKDFLLMHSSYAKNNTSGAIVRRDAAFESFDDVLADILANATVELESKVCLEYLVNAGYITRRKLANISEIITRAKMLRSQKG